MRLRLVRTHFKTRFRAEGRNFGARRETEVEEYPRYFEAETKRRSPKLRPAEPEWGFEMGSSPHDVKVSLTSPRQKTLLFPIAASYCGVLATGVPSFREC